MILHCPQVEEGEKREEQVEEAEEERGERPKLVMMRRMESETTSYDWSTDSESLRSALSMGFIRNREN